MRCSLVMALRDVVILSGDCTGRSTVLNGRSKIALLACAWTAVLGAAADAAVVDISEQFPLDFGTVAQPTAGSVTATVSHTGAFSGTASLVNGSSVHQGQYLLTGVNGGDTVT